MRTAVTAARFGTARSEAARRWDISGLGAQEKAGGDAEGCETSCAQKIPWERVVAHI